MSARPEPPGGVPLRFGSPFPNRSALPDVEAIKRDQRRSFLTGRRPDRLRGGVGRPRACLPIGTQPRSRIRQHANVARRHSNYPYAEDDRHAPDWYDQRGEAVSLEPGDASLSGVTRTVDEPTGGVRWRAPSRVRAEFPARTPT